MAITGNDLDQKQHASGVTSDSTKPVPRIPGDSGSGGDARTPQFKVTGTCRATSKRMSLLIPATDIEAARERAQGEGLQIDSIQLESPLEVPTTFNKPPRFPRESAFAALVGATVLASLFCFFVSESNRNSAEQTHATHSHSSESLARESTVGHSNSRTKQDGPSRFSQGDICGSWLDDSANPSRHWVFSSDGTFQMQEAERRQYGDGWQAIGTWTLQENLVKLKGRVEIPYAALTARTFDVFLIVDDPTTMRGGIYSDGTFRKIRR